MVFHRTRHRLIAAAVLALAGSAWAQTASFDIAAQPLDAALAQLARQAGLQLLAPPALVQGRTAGAVRGSMAAQDAARQLLQGSGLAARIEGSTLVVESAASGDVATLAAVTVTAQKSRNEVTEGTDAYTPRATRSATGMPLSLRETPQSVTVVTAQQIEDRGTTSLVGAMDNVAGVHVVADTARPTLYSRGMAVSNMQVDGSPMFQGGSGISNIQGDSMVAYDRIEVLRGANGLLTGPGDPSASITLVRKRPTRAFQAHVQAGAGSWSNRFADADVSGALNRAGTVRARIAAGGSDGDSFVEETGRRGKALLAVVETDLTPATVARLGYQYDDYTLAGVTSASMVPLWYTNGQPYNAPRSMGDIPRSYALEDRTRHVYMNLEHAFEGGWEFNGVVNRSMRERDYPRMVPYAKIPSYIDPSGLGTTRSTYAPSPIQDRQWSYNFDLQGPLSLAGREHRLMLGASGWRRERETDSITVDWSAAPPAAAYAGLPVREAPYWNPAPVPYQVGGPLSKAYTQQNGIYAAARWNLADSFKLITGVRLTDWKTYTDRYDARTGNLTQAHSGAYSVRREVTPYLGAVWDFAPNLSAYASYADIFKPQNLYDSNDNALNPIKGKSYEAGVKGAFYEGKLNASLAVFRMQQDNLGERDPNFPSDYRTPGGNAPYRAAKGITTNGLDAEISGALRPGWNVSAGYTYARSKNAAGKTFDPNLPEHIFRLFTTYRLPGDWSGLTLGVGANWRSDISRLLQRPTGAYQANGSPVMADYNFRQGSVMVVNAMARYQFTSQLSLQLNVDNLLDKKYYNAISPYTGEAEAYWGQPRRWRVTLRYQL